MKSVFVLTVGLLSLACGNPPQPVRSNAPTNSNDRPQSVIAHTTENQTPVPAASGEKSKWTQSGDPMDTTELDAAVKTAEKALAGKPNDAGAKKSMAEAYLKRAVALTEKRQYASALGDYRRTIKYDPENTEAKDWINKIIMIYDGLNKSYPKEGEEPPPLPFTKGK